MEVRWVAWTAGSMIEVEPRFTGFQILEAVRDAIKFMPNNIYIWC